MIGMFGFGSRGRQAKSSAAVFDPATLTLTGWWRADFSSSPWAGTASAGGSGSNNLSEATNPPSTGTAQNSKVPAAFDGTNDILGAAVNTSALIAGAAGSVVCLFWAVAAASDAGAGNPYDNPALFGDASLGRYAVGYSTSGVRAGYFDGSDWQSVAVAASTGSYHLAQVKHDSTNLKVRVDSGAWSSLARGAASLSTSAGKVGGNFSGAAFFNGRILELMTAQSALSDADFDNIKSYVNSRYALAL